MLEKNKNIFSNNDLLKLFIPIIIEQFLELCVGLTSSIMVSVVGESAVSGVSLVDFFMALVINIFAALATGGAVIAGQYLGKNDKKNSCDAANQLIWFAGLFSIFLMIIFYLIKPFILYTVFGQVTDEVRQHANTYYVIVSASIPFLALYNAGAAIFRTMGNSKISMKLSFLMNGINIAGSAILLYGFHFGTEGVAIPALISRFIAAVLILILAFNKKNPIYIEKTFRHHFNWAIIKRILGIGVPYGLENSLFYLGRIFILGLVSTFGTAAIAANAVGGILAVFEVLPGMAINLGLTVIISRCVGKDDFEQAKYYNKKIIIWVYVANVVMNLIILASLPWIMKIYGFSALAASLTTELAVWHGVVAILIWPLAYTLPVTFRASGDAKYPMNISIITMFLCRVVMAYVLGSFFHLAVLGTWIAMFLDWIVKAVCFIYRYFSKKWMNYRAV